MNEAIKLARNEGWNHPDPCELDGIKFYHIAETFLDPLFWQALGRALGWGTLIGTGKFIEARYQRMEDAEETWKYYAHQYFDLVLTGGDTEKFWKELLTQNDDEPTQTQPS